MGNSGSNKALPSAIPATDILEMIGGQAVIQYNVMPDAATEGMIIQYIGESDATYTSGSWYRGENSEWVLVSSSGGVYVGTGNMPDGYNVQIDPSGDVFDPDNYALKNHDHAGVYQPAGSYATPSDVSDAVSGHNSNASAHSAQFDKKQNVPTQLTALPSSGTALTANTIYNVSAAVGTYVFTPPASGWAHGKFTTDSSASVSFAGTFLCAAPSIEASKTYEFDVLNGVWAVQEVVSA